MNSLSLLLGACLALCATQLALAGPQPSKLTDRLLASWEAFKAEHGRSYESEADESMRRSIFLANKQKVELFNEHLSQSAGYKLGLNHMSDWTAAEVAKLNGFKLNKRPVNSPRAEKFLQDILDDASPVPDEVDWRKVPNRVSHVKNQGQCGSCWAFATTGVLEGQQVVQSSNKSAKLVELSEQNLVDCVTEDKGCDGGIMDDAMKFIYLEGGIDSETSYPYEAKTGVCRFNESNVVMTDSGSAFLPQGDEEALKKMVAKFGPVSVAIDADSDLFQHYSSGVFYNPDCSSTDLDHGVLVVGYGTDPEGGDFWLVKNSWSEKWGEKGYIRMTRNKNNHCGITSYPVIPIFLHLYV